MTKIILTRHGHVEGITPERFRGRLDLPLTALGHRQIDATSRRINAAWRVAAIYTSPMSRGVITGQAIAASAGQTASPLPGLNDIDYGEWQGLTRDEAAGRWPDSVATWYRAPQLAQPPCGETLQDVLARVAAMLGDVLAQHSDDTIVLVGHDSVNRVILMHALDLPLSRYWFFKQEPCAINELDFVDGAFAIRTINETYHLDGV
ncbi:MAG TPA: histidine phosphatase family protein [Stellaceae bacterium]|nr:histidine phosphatase family protein [Stellaceae bacterium]